jgi:hypothetical protein
MRLRSDVDVEVGSDVDVIIQCPAVPERQAEADGGLAQDCPGCAGCVKLVLAAARTAVTARTS